MGVDLDYMGQCSGLLPESSPAPTLQAHLGLSWEEIPYACDTAHSEKSKAQGSLFSLLALY